MSWDNKYCESNRAQKQEGDWTVLRGEDAVLGVEGGRWSVISTPKRHLNRDLVEGHRPYSPV